MKPKACVPCAKRKVRCDGEQPCRHCKRRKHDQCAYPLHLSPASSGQPKSPESLGRGTVRSDDVGSPYSGQPTARPLMINTNGRSVYLESPAWQNWNGKISGPVRDLGVDQAKLPQVAPRLTALQSILNPDSSVTLSEKHPSASDAETLWEIYSHRVNPIIKVTFDWQLTRLRETAARSAESFTSPEHALLLSIYFASVRCLSDEECLKALGEARSELLQHFQHSCEQALVSSQFFTSSDLTVLQAVTIYTCAGFGVMGTKSLQSLVGLAVRNGERIGLHRDGSILGLSPYETEQRRRIWWQLQQLDLGLSVDSGSTSLTLTAEWDTSIPLNIEDGDLNLKSRALPEERKGTTSMSYCLSAYWVIQEMQRLCRTNFGKFTLSWPSEKSWSKEVKRSIIDQLEDGLNSRFLQFCDPIRPLDTFMQITCRMTICTLRRFMLHPLAHNGTVTDLTAEHRQEILDLSVKCLEYDIALNSNPALQPYRWRMRGLFPWSALIYVLIEACQKGEPSTTNELWRLIAAAYGANPNLLSVANDHRKAHAAKLLSAAWEGHAKRCPRQLSKPEFLRDLEARLAECVLVSHHGTKHEAQLRENSRDRQSPPPDQTLPSKEHPDLDLNLPFDPDEIDWLFWDAQLEDFAT